MIEFHTNHQTRKYSSKFTRHLRLRFFSKTIIRKFLILNYILIFFYIFAKKCIFDCLERKHCLNFLNPSLVTLVTTKEKSRAMAGNNPYLDIMIPKSHQHAPVCIFLTGQYSRYFESMLITTFSTSSTRRSLGALQ